MLLVLPLGRDGDAGYGLNPETISGIFFPRAPRKTVMDFILEVGILVECRSKHIPKVAAFEYTIPMEFVQGRQCSFVDGSTHRSQ